jgi:hypothetical protein
VVFGFDDRDRDATGQRQPGAEADDPAANDEDVRGVHLGQSTKTGRARVVTRARNGYVTNTPERGFSTTFLAAFLI